MKTPQQINQMRLNPNGVAVDQLARLTTNSDVPKLVPLSAGDAGHRVSDLVIENAAGVPCSVYLVLIPDSTKAAQPAGSSKREQKLATIEQLWRMGYTAEKIANMYRHSAAAISQYMSRNGRPLSSIPRSAESLILDPVTEPPEQELILG
ncbi:hypothetical protein AYI98_14415 [Shewanella algae]|nr:hypothetical protein AYI98_14415 [Shewanella algae]TVL62834.1 hypothetical protein AYJ00_10855 [Shewanella algae]